MTDGRPPLPVPALEDSLQQYLDALEPILEREAYNLAVEQTRNFVEGDGKKLQRRLQRYAEELGGKSWLYDYSRERFLSNRAPLTIAGNFTIELNMPAWFSRCSQPEAAALLAHSIGRLYRELVRGNPDKRQEPVPCPEQLTQVLGAVRRPQRGMDAYAVYPAFSEAHSFGLFVNNRYYLLRLFDSEGGLCAPEAIYSAVRRIVAEKTETLETGFHTAGFAGSEECALFLEECLSDEWNRGVYEKMSRSIFHLSLDAGPRSAYSQTHLLFSDTGNLWPYKPWSVTLFADNAVAVNNEHTAADGLTNVYLYEQLLHHMEPIELSAGSPTAPAETQRLAFRFTARQTERLRAIRQRYLVDAAAYRSAGLRRTDVDWAWFRERGIGRDSLIQFGYIYAQYRVYGQLKSTHESVSTAHYFQGRTSCIRTATPAAARLAEAMAQGLPDGELLARLGQYAAQHADNIRRAKRNICFIRHSAGLAEMYRRFHTELRITRRPPILEAAAYRRYCTQEISTSTVGSSAAVKAFAFAPTLENGLGIAYLTQGRSLLVSTIWNGGQQGRGDEFTEHLNAYWERIAQLLPMQAE